MAKKSLPPTKSGGPKGRSSIGNAIKGDGPAEHGTGRHTPIERITQVNRGIDSGSHRNDRRDMSPTYTGNDKHAARGSTPRKDVKTRKR